MTSYEFQSGLYRTEREMLDAIAEAWITAGGANSAADVAESLGDATDDALAAETIESWGLDRRSDDDEIPSHMERHGYTAAALAGAFARFRERASA